MLLLLLLLQALRALNVTAAFNPKQADLSRLSAESLYITDVMQSVSESMVVVLGWLSLSEAYQQQADQHCTAGMASTCAYLCVLHPQRCAPQVW